MNLRATETLYGAGPGTRLTTFDSAADCTSLAAFPCLFFISDVIPQEHQARALLKLLAGGTSVAIVRSGDAFDAASGARAADRAVLGYFGDAAALLPASADDGFVFRGTNGEYNLSVIAGTKFIGWKLIEILQLVNPAHDGIPVAGLRITFNLSTDDNLRIGALREKLTEAGALIDPGADEAAPDVVLCRDITVLDGDRPAIGINLAGPEAEPLGIWIQTHSLATTRLPTIVNALEAVAATPLNQWRRWMC